LSLPDRRRSIRGSFSWIDHRFLCEGFDEGLTRLEKLLYFVLVAVSNQDGVSFYSDARLAELLDVRFPHELDGARQELVARDLIAYEAGIYQVLDLPACSPRKTRHSSPPLPAVARYLRLRSPRFRPLVRTATSAACRDHRVHARRICSSSTPAGSQAHTSQRRLVMDQTHSENLHLVRLVADALGEIERLGYRKRSRNRYRTMWEHLIEFSHRKELGDEFSADLVARFLEEYRVSEEQAVGRGDGWRRHMTFGVKMLADFAKKGRIERPFTKVQAIHLVPAMHKTLHEYK